MRFRRKSALRKQHMDVQDNCRTQASQQKGIQMSKCVIELDNNAIVLQQICFSPGHTKPYIKYSRVCDLKELTPDYIQKHFGQLIQDSYEGGYEDGCATSFKQVSDAEYQKGFKEGMDFSIGDAETQEFYKRGLEEGNDIGYKDGFTDGQNEAWKSLYSVFCMPIEDIRKIFGCVSFASLYKKYSAQEVMSKLNEYKKEQARETECSIRNNIEDMVNKLNVKPEDIGRVLKEMCSESSD